MFLVAYYSLSGKTAAAARSIAEALRADLLVIEDVRPRKGFFGFMRSGFESTTARQPRIRLSREDLTVQQLAAYDGVILMTPVWAGSISSPLRTFANRYKQGICRYGLLAFGSDPKPQSDKPREAVEAILGAPALHYDLLFGDATDLPQQLETISDTIRKTMSR
jgi:hypothetical protein